MKSCCSSSASMNRGCLAASIATGLAGMLAGGLSFGSFVDVRSLLLHVDKGNTDLIQSHFPIWWPCGRDYMVPLIGLSSLVHGMAYAMTKHSLWIGSGVTIFLIGPYTALVLGEDIETLRKSDTTEVSETTKRFCNLHHVRTGMALTALVCSLSAMGQQFRLSGSKS